MNVLVLDFIGKFNFKVLKVKGIMIDEIEFELMMLLNNELL